MKYEIRMIDYTARDIQAHTIICIAHSESEAKIKLERVHTDLGKRPEVGTFDTFIFVDRS